MEIKYDRIGKDYNRTRMADKYLSERLFFHLKPEKNKVYIDIGCGTGNYTIELQKKDICILGIDP
jgi:ubiquinone/menaquinone biosynthesis C-methylase UbiE